MARTTCIQCESIYDEGEKFCPKDDTPLIPLVECGKCRRPLSPSAPFCAHCRGVKGSAARTVRGGRLPAALGAAALAVLALAGLRHGSELAREVHAWIASSPAAAPNEGAGSPASAGYDFTLNQPSLLGDTLVRGGASLGAAPLARPVARDRVATRPLHAGRSPVPRAAAARPSVRRVALHVPRAQASPWTRDDALEGELARLGMPEVRVQRNGRSLRLTGSVASDGGLRNLYGFIYHRGYGEVNYEVEVR